MENAKLRFSETLRRTIMKQEETFRYQVHELHRLYRKQKSLMTEVTVINQWDQNFKTYLDYLQSMELHKENSCSNNRVSASTSGTSRNKQYIDIGSDGESGEINLTLTLGNGIGSRPKREPRINDNKSNAAGVPWLYQASS